MPAQLPRAQAGDERLQRHLQGAQPHLHEEDPRPPRKAQHGEPGQVVFGKELIAQEIIDPNYLSVTQGSFALFELRV